MRIYLANSSPATQFLCVLDLLNPFSASHHADGAGQLYGPRHTCAAHHSRHLSAHSYQGGLQGARLSSALKLLDYGPTGTMSAGGEVRHVHEGVHSPCFPPQLVFKPTKGSR